MSSKRLKSRNQKVVDEDDDKMKKCDPFAPWQLLWYILSSTCMTLYCLHYILSLLNDKFPFIEYSFPLDHRVQGHLLAEVVILFGRSYNEYQYGRWGTLDVMHHSVFLYAVYLGLYFPPCIPFAWLICHMQALHFPLTLWYLGGKRGSYSNHPQVVILCRSLFPMTWFWAASYRFAIMTTSAGVSYLDANYITTFVLVFKGSVMAYLDYGWSQYFIGALLKKDKDEKDDRSTRQLKQNISNKTDGRKFVPGLFSIVVYCLMGFTVGITVAGYL